VKRRIFICDDEAETLVALSELLRNAGYDVCTAVGHDEMLQQIQLGNPPDLIVLDVRMPERDGIWIAENLRALGVNVPIIFHTGCDSLIYRLYAPFVGAAAYLTKPCDASVLLSKIEKALEFPAPV
jgi:DNA-binding response OmpR family regulator